MLFGYAINILLILHRKVDGYIPLMEYCSSSSIVKLTLFHNDTASLNVKLSKYHKTDRTNTLMLFCIQTTTSSQSYLMYIVAVNEHK